MAINAAHVKLATKINALEGKLIYGPRTYYSEHIIGDIHLRSMNTFATHPAPNPLCSLNAKRAHLFLRDRDQQPASFRQGDGKGRGFDLNQPLSPAYLQRNARF